MILRPLPPPRRPLRTLARLLAATSVLALLALVGVALSNKAFRQTVAGVVVGANPKTAFGKDAITLLVLGKDEDRDHRDRVMDTRGRSDTILLARLDFDDRRIDVLSIPRDTRVRVPGARGYRKINAAHAIGGYEKTAETIQNFLGVATDSVVVVSYDMLCQMIDDLGGVTVKVDKPLDYDDNWGNLHIHLKPGVQTLNGTDAMGFARFRHSNDGGGDSDFARIERQQTLLLGLKARLKEPSAWPRIPRVLETVRREMEGTLTYPQLVALANFARGVPHGNIRMHTLPSRPGRVFVYPDRAKALALAARLFPVSTASVAPPAESAPRVRRPVRAPRPAAPAVAAPAVAAPPVAPRPAPVVEIEEDVVEETTAPEEPAPASIPDPNPNPAPDPTLTPS